MNDNNWRQQEEVRRLRDEIVDTIERFLHEHGYSPTRVELGEILGRNDKNIGTHIKALVEEGRLTEGRGPRTLSLPL